MGLEPSFVQHLRLGHSLVKDDLLVIVPSRARPHNLRRLLRAWLDTEATADLIVCVDDDDPFLPEYLALSLPLLTVGPRQGLVAWTNEAALEFADQYRFLGSLGDDHVPRTVGWDQRLCASLERVTFAYGDDLIQHEALPTACLMRSEVVTKLGYMCPPSLEHQYVDNCWLEWGKAVGICYHPTVVIEYLHPLVSKAPPDAVYAQSQALMQPDALAFAAYMASQFTQDVRKLRSAS